MGKDLERDLGLYATITISIGAMVGSGIFVLPGLATKIAGPAAILAYFLAGMIVLPAALAKAEMATAMPEAGGTYLYIDRAMGPLPGTVAGVGAWFSLVFKSAFALVGLGSYLLVFVPGLRTTVSVTVGGAVVSQDAIALVALGLAVLLLVVNVVGVKQTGVLQAAIVSLVLLSLVGFVADGITYVDRPHYHPFFEFGAGGLFAATGFVFVSYAGVTKIASVAEEVEDPGRNIPIGILASIGAMMLVYTLVVFVVVGVAPADGLQDTLTPMALAAGEFAGDYGRIGISVVAVLALTSMANAGILSSARFPFAMSRDDLAPASLGQVHRRFRTPVYSVAFTGAVLVLLIVGLPVIELAKLASAFQILVFSFENLALVAFRESDLESYDPEFVAPGYPWVQLFGIAGGLSLITVMGTVPVVGAVGMIAVGVAWYALYGRERTEREGAALDAIRRTTSEYSIEAIERLFTTGGGGGVLVALGGDSDVEEASSLLRIADAIASRRGGQVKTVRFEAVPDQVPLTGASDRGRSLDGSGVSDTSGPADADHGTPTAGEDPPDQGVEPPDDRADTPDPSADGGTRGEPGDEGGATAPAPAAGRDVDDVVSHKLDEALANYAERTGVNVIVGEYQADYFHGELLGEDIDWYMRNVPKDFVFVQDRGLAVVGTILVVADQGPYDPMEVLLADALAAREGASIRFVYAVDPDTSPEETDAIESYHERLLDLTSVPSEWTLLRTDDRESDLIDAAEGVDLVVASTSAHHIVYDVVFGTIPDTLARELSNTVVLVHSHERRRHTFLRYVIERFVF